MAVVRPMKTMEKRAPAAPEPDVGIVAPLIFMRFLI